MHLALSIFRRVRAAGPPNPTHERMEGKIAKKAEQTIAYPNIFRPSEAPRRRFGRATRFSKLDVGRPDRKLNYVCAADRRRHEVTSAV